MLILDMSEMCMTFSNALEEDGISYENDFLQLGYDIMGMNEAEER